MAKNKYRNAFTPSYKNRETEAMEEDNKIDKIIKGDSYQRSEQKKKSGECKEICIKCCKSELIENECPECDEEKEIKMEHQWNKRIADEQGLGYCDVCKGAEASLTTDCSGKPISNETDRAIMDGILDYRDGKWVDLKHE